MAVGLSLQDMETHTW